MSTIPWIRGFRRTLLGVGFAGCIGLATVQGAVQNGALLQGNEANGSDLLSSTTPVAISFNVRSSFDPNVFDHSFANPTQLTVKEAGDYLVAATLPLSTAAGDRSCHAIEVYINGSAVPGAISQPSYIRNTSSHSESSDNLAVLVPGVQAGDVMELMVYRTSNFNAVMETASLYVEKVDASRAAFAATATATTDGNTNLNRDVLGGTDTPAELAWSSVRKDAGLTHTDGSGDVQLDAIGDYLIFVNIPMQGSVTRASVGIELTDASGTPISGYYSQQGYLRNTVGHNEVSVHLAARLRTTVANQVVKVTTLRRANSGDVTIQNGKAASIYIEKVGTAGMYSAVATEVEANDPNNWNPAFKSAIRWPSAGEVIDGSVYQKVGTTGIRVTQAGSYLLVYQDSLECLTVDRPAPRITVEVNGVEGPGAQTKTHYIRRAGEGHNESSATLTFMLEGLEADDVITVSTQQEAAGAVVTGITDQFKYYVDGVARMTILRRPNLPADPGSAIPPRLVFADGDLRGFAATLEALGASIDLGSVQVLIDGVDVSADATATPQGTYTVVSYDYVNPNFPALGSQPQVVINFNDANAQAHSVSFSFMVSTPYVAIPPEFRVEGPLGAAGFEVKMRAADAVDDTGAAVTLPNSSQRAEEQIRDLLINPFTGAPYVNVATIDTTVESGIINYSVDQNADPPAGEVGNFMTSTGYPDVGYPGLLSTAVTSPNDENFTIEFVTYLDLPAGLVTLGVNSDDGFVVTTAPNPRDLLGPLVLGVYEGGRGASDTLFIVQVTEAGYYPVRLLQYQGNGGGNVEFFSVADDGMKIPINDTATMDAIAAYQSVGAGAGALVTLDGLTPFPDSVGNPVDATVRVLLRDGTTATVNQGSIQLTWNGTLVTHGVTKAGAVSTITYDPGPLALGTVVNNSLTFSDSNAKDYTVEWTWEVKGEIRMRIFGGDSVSEPLSGGTITDMVNSAPYQENRPHINEIVDQLEILPTGRDDNYGTEFLGYFTAAISDWHTFILSSDDDSDLYLSTDESPANVTRIAFMTASNANRQWTGGTEINNRTSEEILLEAGQRYFIQVLHRDGTGGDHCAVAFTTRTNPDISDGDPPVSGRLTAFNGVDFAEVPLGGSVAEGRSWSFSARVVTAVEGTITYQWLKNGSPIAGQDLPSYDIPLVTLGDAGDYALRATVGGTTVTSPLATLAVIDDSTPPSLVSAGFLPGSGAVGLKFSEPVNINTATFTVAGATVSASQVIAVNDSLVKLTVTGTPAAGFDATANNVQDKVGNVLTTATVTGQVSDMATQDLGVVAETGEAFSFGVGYYVASGGNDLWTAADGGYYVYKQFTGPLDMRARVDSLNYGDEWAKASLMVRESLDAGSVNQAVLVTKNGPFPGPNEVSGGPYFDGGVNVYNHQWRDVTDEASASKATAERISPTVFPSYIRIVREDAASNEMKSYISYDGQDWILFHTYTLPDPVLPASVYVGMAGTAHDNTAGYARAEAVYDEFSVVAWTPPAGEPELSVAVEANGDLTLTFEGTLQAADDAAGPYTDTLETSPASVTPTEARKFYRAKQ